MGHVRSGLQICEDGSSSDASSSSPSSKQSSSPSGVVPCRESSPRHQAFVSDEGVSSLRRFPCRCLTSSHSSWRKMRVFPCLPFDTASFVNIDMFFSAFFGLAWLLCPQIMAAMQVPNQDFDAVHIHLARTLGLVLLGSVLVHYLSGVESNDQLVRLTLMASRTVGVSLLLSTMVYSYFAHPHWNTSVVVAGTLLALVWGGGNVFCLVHTLSCHDRHLRTLNISSREGDFVIVEKSISHPIDFFLRLDFSATFAFGLFWLAMPDAALLFQTRLNVLDEFHMHSARVLGALLIGSSMVSSIAPYFRDVNAKVATCQARVVHNTVLLMTTISTHFTSDIWSSWHLYFGITGILLWTINAISGVLSLRGEVIPSSMQTPRRHRHRKESSKQNSMSVRVNSAGSVTHTQTGSEKSDPTLPTSSSDPTSRCDHAEISSQQRATDHSLMKSEGKKSVSEKDDYQRELDSYFPVKISKSDSVVGFRESKFIHRSNKVRNSYQNARDSSLDTFSRKYSEPDMFRFIRFREPILG